MNWKKGMKWIVAVFAMLVLMSVFVGAVSAEEISKIELTGVIAPVAGQSPQTSGISAGDKLNVDSYDWKTESGNSVGQSFDYDTVYELSISITVKDNNNTLSAPSVTSDAGNPSYAGGKVTITFDRTAVNPNAEITGVTLSLTAPVVNQNPSQPSVSGTGVSSSAEISWTPTVTEKFAGNTPYTAKVTVSSNNNYLFPPSPSNNFVTYAGAGTIKSVTPKDSSKKLEIVIEFPATATIQLESPTPEISGFAADKTSGTAPLTVSFSFNHKNATSFELMSGTDTLKSGTASPLVYTFTTVGTHTVKLIAKNGTKSVESSPVTITVSAAETTLDAVNINITAPVAGATPATNVSGVGILSQSVVWSPTVSSTFAAGTQYKATIKVKNATGYKFSTSIRDHVTVNGVSVAASKVSVSGNVLTVSEYIIGTTSGEISSVSLTVDVPVLGSKPDTDVSKESSANYDVSSITWYKNSVSSSNKINTSDTFAEKTTYIAEIKLTAKDKYVFNSTMKKASVKVNNNAVSSDLTPTDGYKKLTVQYTFPATGEAQKPVITLTAEPANPVIKSGLDSVGVKFTYKITGDFDSASLNFGDNSKVSITQSGGTEPHTYTSASTFTVIMRAGNENGTTTKTLSLPITKEQFKASFDASLLSGEAPLKVLFTDTSTGTSGKLIQRSWDFDDGTTAAAQTSVTHTFEKEGTYYVRLFISDGVNQHTATKTITVTKKGGDDKVKIDVEYEPFIIIGDVGVPSPFDLIAEFVRLIQAMLNFDNYTFYGENSES